MKRIECLRSIATLAGNALVVTGAGANTTEWNACCPGDGNFRVRTMGLVSSIALGIALGLPKRKVIAIDGDGSLLMNLSSLPTIAKMNPPNLTHIVFDNEAYEASGEINTATNAGTDLVALAKAAGISKALWTKNIEEFRRAMVETMEGNQLSFICSKIELVRTETPPYPMDEVENKYRFIRHVEQTEKLEILTVPLGASFLKE